MSDKVRVFTDGACRGNPGPGGWGAILRYGDREKEIYGAERSTTNNRMELMAAIQALEALNRPCEAVVTTDEWLPQWKRRGWRTAAKQPVKNQDLWERLERAIEKHRVEWEWIKGHSGHDENERADRLANRAIDEMLS